MGGTVRVMLFFVLYSIYVFFSLFFFSDCLQNNNRRGGAGQDITGPTRATTATRDGTEGQAGGREEEIEGLAGGLRRRAGGEGERGQTGD